MLFERKRLSFLFCLLFLSLRKALRTISSCGQSLPIFPCMLTISYLISFTMFRKRDCLLFLFLFNIVLILYSYIINIVFLFIFFTLEACTTGNVMISEGHS